MGKTFHIKEHIASWNYVMRRRVQILIALQV